MHEYQATVVRWIDGDTVVLEMDLGFHVRITEHIRLMGYDAPEAGQPRYAEAKARATELCPPGSTVWVVTHKAHARSFTRWVGTVYPADMGMYGVRTVQQILAEEGLSK